MALPKINDSIKYNVVIPSIGKEVRFRPYLVKEEKILLQAFETGDDTLVLDAVVDTLEACITDPIDKKALTTFDIEYLFLKVRGKSVGEKSDIRIGCSKCEEMNEYTVDLDAVECTSTSTEDKTIEITDDLSVEMKFPAYKDLIGRDLEDQSADAAFSLIMSSMKAIKTADDYILLENESTKDLQEFIESMTQEQFGKLTAFLSEMPKVVSEIEFNCIVCGEKNKRTIEGMQNFF